MKKSYWLRNLLAVAWAGSLVLGMAGCQVTNSAAGESAPPSAPLPSSGTPESAAPPEGGEELTLWIFLNPESAEDPRNVVLKEIVDEYNASNTMGNTVKVESINYSKFESQAIQAAAAGTGPDIINVYSDMLKQHIAGGTIQPMTKYAEEWLPSMEGYGYSAEDLKIDGEIYSLPWESRTFMYWYRTDLFDGAPASLDALADAAAAKSDAMAQGFVIGLSDGANGASFMESFVPYLRSAGGSLFDSSGKAAFNDGAGVRVLEFVKSLIDKGAMDQTVLSLTVDDVVDAFKAGTILSCNAGTQRAASIRASELTGSIASAPIVGFQDGAPSPAVVAGQTLGIGKYCKNPDAAFDFIKTFYTKENQVKWLKANVLPALSTAYDDADIQAMENYGELKSWNEYSAQGKIEFYPADYGELSVKLVQAAQNVVFHGADPKAELDAAAQWYNEKNA